MRSPSEGVNQYLANSLSGATPHYREGAGGEVVDPPHPVLKGQIAITTTLGEAMSCP